MTASYVVATPIQGVSGTSFAVVADDTQARYVFADGSDSGAAGLDGERIQRIVEVQETPPATVDDWLAIATSQLGDVSITDPVDAATIDEAVAAAQEALATPTGNPVGPSDWVAPTTRAELMAWQARMMYEWAQEYPEAASGDVDDPDADLALEQMLTPPVNPDEPHKWLPLAVGDVNCGFCDKPAEDAIHQANADTITRGSN